MRILLVNWAYIWDGAAVGGGANGYLQALALELLHRGHEVIALCGGTRFTAQDARVAPCEIRRHDDWLGIRVFEVVNSPVLAPSILQFNAPEDEIAAPELEARLAEFLARLRPDVVHFHNLEGFSAGCVEVAQRADGDWPGARVVVSLHNYHTICPQVYLMQGHDRPCHSAEGGRRCDGCIDACDPREERLRRAGLAPQTGGGPALSSRTPSVLGRLVRAITLPAQNEQLPPAANPTAPDPAARPILGPADVLLPRPRQGDEARGRTIALQTEADAAFRPRPDSPEWQAFDNGVRPELSPDPSTRYGRRRLAMLRALNRCDAVLAVSGFVHRKFESLGVSPARLRTLHIGTRAGELAARHAELVFDPPPFDRDRPRPVRLAFMGYDNYYKGLHVLADALELLTPEVLARFEVSVYALGGKRTEWRFSRLQPRLAGLRWFEGYEYRDIPWMLGGQDLGVVPSTWWDNGPQTVFEFFACRVPVLGAGVGGIPDFVRHGENGLLFRGNDRYDLARTLARVAREPWTLTRLRAGVRPPKSIQTHAAEVEAVYAECIHEASRRRAAAATA